MENVSSMYPPKILNDILSRHGIGILRGSHMTRVHKHLLVFGEVLCGDFKVHGLSQHILVILTEVLFPLGYVYLK